MNTLDVLDTTNSFLLLNNKIYNIDKLPDSYIGEIKSNNTLTITKISEIDDKLTILKKNNINIANEITKREEDIKLLEKSFKEISDNLVSKFDPNLEETAGREMFTLLGQISNHKQKIKGLREKQTTVEYTVTTTKNIITLEFNKLTSVEKFFVNYDKVFLLWTNIKAESHITTSITKEIKLVNNNVKNKQIYASNLEGLWYEAFIIEVVNNTATIHFKGYRSKNDEQIDICGDRILETKPKTVWSPGVYCECDLCKT